MLDPNIFLRGAALQQANSQRFQGNLFDSLDRLRQDRRYEDLMKQRTEDIAREDARYNRDYDLRKQQFDLEKEKAGALNFDKLVEGAGIKLAMGEQLNPAEDAALKYADALRVSQNAIDPTTGSTYQKNRSIFDILQTGPMAYSPGNPFVENSGPSQITPGSPTIGSPSLERAPDLFGNIYSGAYPEGGMTSMADQSPDFRLPANATPKTRQKAQESFIDAQQQIYIDRAKNDLEVSGEAMKKAQQQTSVGGILARMREINNSLNSKGAIASEGRGFLDNAEASLATDFPGSRTAQKSLNPEAQALRDEYDALRSTLLPFYATAAGLGAKSLDSDGERRAILDSFGSPGSLYEANESQLNTLDNLLGEGAKNRGNKPQPTTTNYKSKYGLE